MNVKKRTARAPLKRAVPGRRRRPAMCATMQLPGVRRVAKELKIKLQTKRHGKRDKPQLCRMIKRKVCGRTPIRVRVRKLTVSGKKVAPKKKLVAAPRNTINLTAMSNTNSNSNNNSSNFRIVYTQAPIKRKRPPQEVRRDGANSASINAAMNKIRRGRALTPEENRALQENVRKTQRTRWSSIVNRHDKSAGAPDPLSDDAFRRLRSKYNEGRATKIAKTGNLRGAGKVYTFR